MQHITVSDFHKLMTKKDYILLDVRSNGEFELVNLGGTHIPLDELETRFSELDLKKDIYCLCHHGVRSSYAAQYLEQVGAKSVWNIEGGIDAYSLEIDADVRRY